MDSSSDRSTAAKEEAYFAAYAHKASKMKGWQLVSELAHKVANFDELDAEILKGEATSSNSSMGSRTSKQIEILMKENLKRKQY